MHFLPYKIYAKQIFEDFETYIVYINVCLLASSLLLPYLNWRIATFLGMLPPPAVSQRYSVKPSAGICISVLVHEIQTKNCFIVLLVRVPLGHMGAAEAALNTTLTHYNFINKFTHPSNNITTHLEC